MKNNKVSQSAIFSYFLSILYLILRFIIGNEEIVNYIFIIIHILLIGFGLLIFFWIYVAVFASFLSGMMPESDKNKAKLMLKTWPHRIGLGILCWLLPIGLYCYYIFYSNYLYIFVWLPLWFPFVYYFIEKYIENKEAKIGSPVAQNW